MIALEIFGEMVMLVGPQHWSPLVAPPAPPKPPHFISPPRPGPAGAANGQEVEAGQAPASESIGVSPVVMAFLLRLQELGLTSIAGTDGDDALSGWSKSLIDGGDGDDSVDAWSDSVVDAGAGDDSVRAWSDSVVQGGAGNDQLDVWSGSAVDGGSGNDIIRAWSDTVVAGGDGDDQISAWSNSKVGGGSGNDTISAWSNSHVEGGDGDDVISVHSDSIAVGGRGNDTIALRSDSIARFAAGDGNDTIYAGFNSTIELGSGLTPAATSVEIEGNIAKIRFADGSDSIDIHLMGTRPATLSFADGTRMEIVGEAGPALSLSEANVTLAR
jgi:Ca2+-binding RTX toxin-like protein